jgi:poly(beta-D-mannuronate) lyase
MSQFDRRPLLWRFTFLPALMLGVSIAHAATPLRSPWDGKAVVLTKVPYACPAVPVITPDLTTDGFYRLDDPTHSIIDPVRQAAYNASSGPVKQVGLDIVAAADAYRTTGSREAARCVVDHILSLAKQNSLAGKMSSSQAYYVQGWVIGAIAIADLKVREAIPFTGEQGQMVSAWMHSVGAQTVKFYEDNASKHGNEGNNHLYWAGVELAAIGVVANRRDDFEWGLAAYENGVRQIRPNGTLPLEMARGGRALHYHLYALAPLVLLAEFGEANGMDLYASSGGAIHRLVKISVGGLTNPSQFENATGVKQEVPKVPSGDQIGWAPPYVRRFPDATLNRFVANAPTLSVYYLGGLPPS